MVSIVTLMGISRAYVGLFLLFVDFPMFFFFFKILLCVLYALVFFIVCWALFLQNCLQNQFETYYFPSEKVCVCFCQVPGPPTIKDYLNLTSGLWNT